MRLFHYTCAHSKAKIEDEMVLRPNERSFRRLIWLTDLPEPDVQGLGLTMFTLRCDRTEFRCTVETNDAVAWTTWAHVNKVDLGIRLMLDHVEGAKPRHWWVSTHPIPVSSIERTR